MVPSIARRSLLIALIVAVLLAACSRPKAPTLTPERVDTIGTSSTGMLFRVICKANNPNAYALPTRRASGTITLGAASLGTVEATSLPTLPARSDTEVSFDLVVPWKNLGTALTAAAGSDEIPYTVEGRAVFEAAGVGISAPFTIKGTIRKSELAIPFLRFFMQPNAPKPAHP